MPRLTAVNYSPPFQSPMPLHPASGQPSTAERLAFYDALRIFADLTLEEQFRYERTLSEGECVIFDNRRVLHSRRGFEWDEQAESGDDVKRWLKGEPRLPTRRSVALTSPQDATSTATPSGARTGHSTRAQSHDQCG